MKLICYTWIRGHFYNDRGICRVLNWLVINGAVSIAQIETVHGPEE